MTSLYGDFVYRVDEQKPKDAGASGEPSGEDTKPTLVARQVFVTLGRRNGTLVEIKQGLKPGDRIVTAGQNKVSNGSELVINNSIDPAKIGRQFQALEDGS